MTFNTSTLTTILYKGSTKKKTEQTCAQAAETESR